MRAHLGKYSNTLPDLLQQFSLGTRPHKSRTHNYDFTSAESGLAMVGPARPVPVPMSYCYCSSTTITSKGSTMVCHLYVGSYLDE